MATDLKNLTTTELEALKASSDDPKLKKAIRARLRALRANPIVVNPTPATEPVEADNDDLETEEPQEYRIADWMLDEFAERLAKLNARGAKLGAPPITLNVIRQEIETRPKVDYDGVIKTDYYGHVVYDHFRWYIVSVEGEAPKFAGWKFLGTIESKEQGNILRAIPGEHIPEDFRYRDKVCDHCQAIRRRTDTYVVQHEETGEVKQVGSSCIKDFLGHANPKSIAWYFNNLRAFAESLGGPHEPRPVEVENLLHYLCHVAAMIRTQGWWSKKRALQVEGQNTTASEAAINIDKLAHPNRYQNKWGRWIDTPPIEPTEEDETMARNALHYVRTQPEEWAKDNDFLTNLVTLLKNDVIEPRDFGLAAAAVAVYRRTLEEAKAREPRPDQAPTEWVDAPVGDRLAFTITVDMVKVLEDDVRFGTKVLVKMHDDEDHILVWFTRTGELEEGKTYGIVATIKDHREYRGIKETVITRAKIVK